jgi:predicted transcriptional regulator
MTAMTVRLPDDKHMRLKALARDRGTTVNRLIEEMATIMLAEFDAEAHFRARAARGEGWGQEGLALLAKAKGRRS